MLSVFQTTPETTSPVKRFAAILFLKTSLAISTKNNNKTNLFVVRNKFTVVFYLERFWSTRSDVRWSIRNFLLAVTSLGWSHNLSKNILRIFTYCRLLASEGGAGAALTPLGF